MKNIFAYATKELSQDAFLMWLFENFDCKDSKVKKASLELLKIMTGIDDLNIKSISVIPQWNRIDITVEITKADDKKMYLFIEDKTTSEEHNQLKTYNEKIEKNIDKLFKGDIKKVYYKTAPILKLEKERVEKAGWEIIEFKTIKEFWSKYIDSKNIILNMYANHVCTLWDDFNCQEIPQGHNMNQWWSFFYRVVGPEMKQQTKCDYDVVNYSGHYYYLKVMPGGKLKEKYPYLEIRDKECVDGKVRSLIEMYYDGKTIDEGKDELKNVIHGSTYFNKKNNKNQVGQTEFEKFSDKNAFIKICKEMINDYLDICKKWEKKL